MYIISACLCGVNCKYNSNNNYNEYCNKLFINGEAILVCPEQLGGLPTPRVPSEILGTSEKVVIGEGKVITKEGVDVSANFIKGAREVVEIAKKLKVDKAILKEGSPSCGVNFIYDGTFSGNKIQGMGKTAFMLKELSIDVISENDLGGE